MISFKTCSVLWTVLFCFVFPPVASGQYIRKETVKKGDQTYIYAVIYAEGLAGSAQWAPGVKMMTDRGITIRHRVTKGNGGNLSVNDRIPFRFIVAPTDVGNNNQDWMTVQGVNDDGNNNDTDFINPVSKGCRSYTAFGRKWRVPTQRELQLMWMFRDPIGWITGYPMEGNATTGSKPKRYWASTEAENEADKAWFFDFETGKPHCDIQLKSTANGMVRCVSDY